MSQCALPFEAEPRLCSGVEGLGLWQKVSRSKAMAGERAKFARIALKELTTFSFKFRERLTVDFLSKTVHRVDEFYM